MQPSPPFSCRLPPLAPKLLGGERWRCPGHLLLPPVSLATPRRRLVSPCSSSSLAAPSLFPEHSPPPLFSSPNAPAAADENHRGHGLSLVPLSSPEAPPRPPLPLHRATRSRTRYNAATIAVPLVGHRRSPPSILRRRSFPEPIELLYESAVSPSSFPLTSLSRACPVAAAPRAPEAAVRHGR